MMVVQNQQRKGPFKLVVTGEAESWLPALELIVGPNVIQMHRVSRDTELLDMVQSRVADAAVIDDQVPWAPDVLQLLRMIRRMDTVLPVVVITGRQDRRWLEDAMRLAVFSVVCRPLELEELLRQIQRIMARLDWALRHRPGR